MRRKNIYSLIVLLSLCIIFPVASIMAQEVNEKRVSLDLKAVQIKRLFDEIRKQTGLNFVYNTEQTNSLKPITIKVRNVPIREVMQKVFANTGFIYNIEGNIITIRKSNIVTSPVQPVAQQIETKIFRGTVFDSNKVTIPGVSIWLVGTKVGTHSEPDGTFLLEIPNDVPNPTIQFSLIGMETYSINYRGENELVVTLRENPTMLNEVGIVSNGMFLRKSESFTGAVTTYTKTQLKSVGNQNLLASLATLDPSFVMAENLTYGSDPNQLPDIQLRGQNNINIKGDYSTSPNQPLFILNGFETTIEKIYDMDMNLVSSITLLKDAAAKAIYGSKAANGVVVIETQLPNEGNLRVSYTGGLDITLADLTSYDLTNPSEKLQAELLAGKYTSTNAQTQAALTQRYNELKKEIERGVNTYWMSKPLRTGIGTKHSLYLDGGDQSMRYAANLAYNNIAGVMKGSDRTTISGDITLSYRYKSLSFRNNLSIDNNKAINSPYGDFSDYSKMNPYWRIYDENGSLIKQYSDNISAFNPLYNAGLNSKDESKYTTITENFYGEWQALSNLKITARIGYKKQNNKAQKFIPASNTRYANISSSSSEYLDRGEYSEANGNSEQISADIGVAYSLQKNKHVLYANAIYNIEESRTETTTFSVVGFPSDKMDYPSFGNHYPDGGKPSGSESTTRSVGVVGAANYSYDNRYLADLSYRLNASSQFGADHRWGSFWSFGLGWNIVNESFMKSVSFVDYLKLRASVGYTGSQAFNPYQSISTYTYITDKSYNGDMGAVLMGLANTNLGWQRQYDRNIGLDISLARRLSARADFYLATTDDLLTPVTLAPSSGFASYIENLGKTENKGFELSVNYKIYNNQTTRSYINLYSSIAHNTNKIKEVSNSLKKMNEETDTEMSETGGSEEEIAARRRPSTRYEEGQSLNAIWAVRSAGIDPITGKEVFIKKDGTTTYEWSAADQVVCGDNNPKVRGNIGGSFAHKGFELNLTFTYRIGGQTYNQTLVDKIENADVLNWNVDKRVLTDRWNTPGVAAKFKSITDVSQTRPTSRFVEDLNEFVFSSINFGYDFSELPAIRRSPLSFLKLTFNMNDIAWLSSVKREQGLSYPRARAFSFTVQTRF